MDKNLPLVSVVVITYNSAKTIFDTLESIKNQTYRNIELIISDDCSKDNTIEICKKWLEIEANRFISYKIITTPHNTGVTSNCNRGYRCANGSWIKGIAGDDILNNFFIEKNISWILSNPNIDIVFSKVKILNESKVNVSNDYIFRYAELLLTSRQLFHCLVYGNFLPATTAFIKKEVFSELSGFDETIPMMEDWPFWIKAAYHGKKFSLLNEYMAIYRILPNSISNKKNKSEKYIQSEILAKNYAWQYQKKIGITYRFYHIINEFTNRHKSLKFLKLINYLNPYFYILKNIRNKIVYFQTKI